MENYDVVLRVKVRKDLNTLNCGFQFTKRVGVGGADMFI